MKKLIICIDGLGEDLISKENTPFLYKFGKENYFSRLKTLFAFAGIEQCFFTGKTPDKSGIWLEYSRSKNSIFSNPLLKFLSFNKTLRNYVGAIRQYIFKRTNIVGLHNIPSNKLKYFDSSVKKGLWNLDFFKKKDFVVYKWPLLVTKGETKIIFRYEDDKKRLNRLLAKNKEVYYVQLMGVDKTIHRFGKKSFQAKESLKIIDKITGEAVKKFLTSNEGSEVFIWSDHGFSDIKEYINLGKILPNRKDYLYFIAGTTAHFWFSNKESKEEILKSIKDIKAIKILDKKSSKKYKIPISYKYGELVLFVEKGDYFFPNFYQRADKERFRSMHGYPDDKELDGFFISNKRIAKENLKMKEVLNLIK